MFERWKQLVRGPEGAAGSGRGERVTVEYLEAAEGSLLFPMFLQCLKGAMEQK